LGRKEINFYTMKMKIFKIGLLLLLPLTSYFFMACDAGPGEGDVGTKFSISLVGEGVFCDDFFDGNHPLTMTVTVDKVVNPNLGTTELHDTKIIDVTNRLIGQVFDLNIPETGGFAINVQLNGTQCMKCCSSKCTQAVVWPEQAGKPLLRDLQTFTSDPGGTIIFELDLVACNCCN